jgi:M6 family metalloprotease-like protein
MRKSFKIFSLFLLFSFLTLSLEAYAVSLSPELVEKLRKEGRLDQVVRQANLAREKGVWQPNLNPPLKRGGKSTQVDTIKALVLLVDFDDNVSSRRPGEFDTLLFSKGFVVSTGSMRDFYWENSYHTFELMGDVYGWYRMPQSYVAYACTLGYQNGFGSYPYNAQKLVEDAVNAADPYVNFADYDRDGNGFVDALFVVHAGPGAEETGDPCDIWSHRWVTHSYVYVDGVKVYDYSTEPEVRSGGALVDMGVFCHEFGHVLGLPDLYDTDYSSEGLGNWSIMAGGSWNNGGRTPAHFDAWCKSQLGFSSVNPLSSNQTNVEILQAETSPVSYRLWTSGGGGSEYFLVENRQKTGFDAYLPGPGLLIYHVDETESNSSEWCPGDPPTPHYEVALEQADGRFQLEGCFGGPNTGDVGDPFPGSRNKRAFDDTTNPGSRDYYDNSTQVAVWNISDSDSAMYANMDVIWSRPGLFLNEFALDDSTYGNGNGVPDQGEKIRLYFTISNSWAPLLGTTVTGSADVAGINFTDNHSYVGDIPTGDSVNNYLDPMEFEISPSFACTIVTFTLHVEGNGGTYSVDLSKKMRVGRPEILVVDDDSATGKYNNYESYYTDALDYLELFYDVWDKKNQADTTINFSDYKILIWYTGDHRTSIFSQADIESLMSFLNNGGRLFLTSQDAAEVLSGSADPLFQQFLTEYLHAGYGGNSSKLLVMGEPEDEIGDTLWIRPSGLPGADNQTSKDNLLPDAGADTVLVYADGGWVPTNYVAGTKFQNDYFKVVLFGFGFEAISSGIQDGHRLSKSSFVMQRVLDWLKAPLPTINVTFPNGGEALKLGDTCEIRWECISFEDSVKIEYSTTAGQVWSTIVETTTCDGAYSWTVPDTLVPSDSCLVRISDVGDGIPFDKSDGYFSIINYVPGDANADGMANSADAVYLINYLFIGGSPPNPMAAGDVNGDCIINSSDVVYLINYLFIGGPAPKKGCA